MEHNIILNTKEVKIRYIEKLITNKLEEIYDNFIENEEDKNNEHYIILKTTPKLSNLIKLKLEKQINFINKYDVVGTFCQYFGDKNDCPNLPPKNIIPSILMEFNPIINSSSMFHKKDAYWNQDYHAEDYEMWLRLNFEGKTFYNIPEKLTYHRIHQSSFFNTKYSDNQCIINKWRV